jgi:aldose 1-epimerase
MTNRTLPLCPAGALVATSLLLLTGCQDTRDQPKVTSWGMAGATPVHLFTLSNSHGMTAVISDYGGTVVSLTAPDRSGNYADVVLGYSSPEEYQRPGHSPYFGATIGRYGNRIANGHFTLDGAIYTLATNNVSAGMPCCLHGGLKGFDKVVWSATPMATGADQALELRYRSVDGEEGFPGNLDVTVTFRVTEENELRIDYHAVSDKATPVNLTNHSYFNLKGEGQGDILGHQLTIMASRFTPVNAGMIPTGELRAVKGTPLDFTAAHTIGERIGADYEQLKIGGGYDHNWVIDHHGPGPELAARVHEPTSGRTLEVLTTEPGVQCYTSNFMPHPQDGADKQLQGKSGRLYHYRDAFCLETQHYPDSPNHPDFPSSILRPGQTLTSTTIYRFSAE